MNFVDAIKSGFSNYVTVRGRAVRSEYWYWVLFSVVASLVALTIDAALLGYSPSGPTPITSIFDLVTFLPSLALAARRLHDMDRTAWWLLIALTGIGALILIIWFCFRGTVGDNRFGPDRTPAG
jgi:uncharacterized membrane protein YhaH (DUF805 family)